jgi:hypothetical protein
LTSASVAAAAEPLKAAAKAAVGALRTNDEAALMTFSHSVTLRSGWTTSREAITKAIDGVTATGLTALNDAAFAALAMTSKPGTRRLVLFFTDGDDVELDPGSALIQATPVGIRVYNVTLDSARHSVAAISKMLEATPKPGENLRQDVEQWLIAEPTYRGAALSSSRWKPAAKHSARPTRPSSAPHSWTSCPVHSPHSPTRPRVFPPPGGIRSRWK